ncbi:Glucosidase [Nitrospira tepida]|uniref:Glucosidase n=2 Tax=Nitrospira tepida TaxID=2973512 RepID=A0AA86MXS4_9BACT|nr:Glucosidase [Nitrospira tepida]
MEDAKRIKHWKRWGPYLSERAWGTVREDYSPNGTAWEHFPHDHARSRAYRWNEDGLAGFCDRHQWICFALALWNGRDPILKERAFGLTGNEGNHGEDVKEYYFYLDSTPTHSYMKWLYKYPQAEFPYARLVEENRRRGRRESEFELLDAGVFQGNRYFDVIVEYAKVSPEDLLVQIEVVNRGPETSEITVLPTLWFRNTWSWGLDVRRPRLRQGEPIHDMSVVELTHDYYGFRRLLCQGEPPLLFTENETNARRLWGDDDGPRYAKDGINDYVVRGLKEAVNPDHVGSKVAAHYTFTLGAGETKTIRLRFTDQSSNETVTEPFFTTMLAERKAEADDFYAQLAPPGLSDDAKRVQRQAFAGLLWSKQFYHYDLARWLKGDPAGPEPPASRLRGRNSDWTHLYNADVISMPDKWEYPWYAVWDLAFHCIPLALVDPKFAKDQLILMLREWYMHPNGQIPAYEWAFGDVNPPVHAWAAWRVYKIEKKRTGVGDRTFLERVFHKLLLNFTWWVNRKDAEGKNIFQGGFLGLDNIGVFDRSAPLPTGGHIEQSDATSWMGMYCLNMLAIALELARDNRAYEDVASKFFEHFVYICRAMNHIGGENIELWNKEDGFFYDVLHLPDGRTLPLKVRSMVGLIPLFAVETLDSELIDQLPRFKHRMQWFMENRPDFASHVETQSEDGEVRRFLSLVNRTRLKKVLRYMLDEQEFLSPHGVRALSQYHRAHPYVFSMMGVEHRVDYEPAESSTGLFGGNSNWRGPVWFPVNYLLVESLQKFHYFLGDQFKVECPTGSGRLVTLWEVAGELSRRLVRTFLRDAKGQRPVYGGADLFQTDPHWRDLILFYEYLHGDNGAGIGASHQTGWTGLVAKLIQQSGE